MYLGSKIKKVSSPSELGLKGGKIFPFTNVVRLCDDHGRARRLNISFAHGWVTKYGS